MCRDPSGEVQPKLPPGSSSFRSHPPSFTSPHHSQIPLPQTSTGDEIEPGLQLPLVSQYPSIWPPALPHRPPSRHTHHSYFPFLPSPLPSPDPQLFSSQETSSVKLFPTTPAPKAKPATSSSLSSLHPHSSPSQHPRCSFCS